MTGKKKKQKNFKNPFKSLVELYDELNFVRKVKDSTTEAETVVVTDGNIGIDYMSFQEGHNIGFLYIVEDLPQHLNIHYREQLRDCISGDTKIHFIDVLESHDMQWDSARMVSRLQILEHTAKENKDTDDNPYNQHKNIKDKIRQSRVEKSLLYLSDAETSRERALLKVKMAILVVGTRGKEFDDTIRLFNSKIKNMKIELRRTLFTVKEHLEAFSPFKMGYNKFLQSAPAFVLTDEIYARTFLYEQGALGSKGINFGSDISNGLPVTKVVKSKYDNAETWIVTAETGGGKSTLVKDVKLQLAGFDDFIFTTMDIEGFEYRPLKDFLSNDYKTLILTMGGGTGNYLDPVQISSLTGDEDVDAELFTVSRDFTQAVFRAMVHRLIERDDFALPLLKKGVSRAYAKWGVDGVKRETWNNAEGKYLHDIYAEYKLMLSEAKEQNDLPERIVTLEKMLEAFSEYFEPTGSSYHMFSNPINMEDLNGVKYLVCSFNMAGKSQDMVDEVQMEITELFTAFLSYQRSLYAFRNGYYNVKLWEEFQRWGKFPNSENTLGVAVTGGRKLGDVNIIITNDVKQILDDDRFSIINNCSSALIGAIVDEKVRAELCERLSIPHMKEVLDEITLAAKKEDDLPQEERERILAGAFGENMYTYSFLTYLDRSRVTVTKMVMEPEVAASKLFRTGMDMSKRKRGAM